MVGVLPDNSTSTNPKPHLLVNYYFIIIIITIIITIIIVIIYYIYKARLLANMLFRRAVQ